MSVSQSITTKGLRSACAIIATPAVIIFLSSNLVNVGNLAFNMIFSRLMGPELFGVLALLLTIKLAFLGVTGALQMAVSQMIAAQPVAQRRGVCLAVSSVNRALFYGVAILCLLFAVAMGVGGQFGNSVPPTDPHLLLILMIAFPFGTALSLLRGVAFGDLRTGRIVASANVEMAVRLVGGCLAWALGFGIEGVVIAISVSIVAGWGVLYNLLPVAKDFGGLSQHAKTLGMAAIPFAVLQLTQVVALDGDIFIARALLPDDQGGFVAALSLFQRIQFFACFALASVLLPRVVGAAESGESILAAASPVFGLFAIVSVIVVAAVVALPGVSITLLLGQAYLPAVAGLLPAVIAAMVFTFSYLVVTLLLALRDMIGIVLIAVGVGLQFGGLAWSDPSDFSDLVQLKAICQILIAVVLTVYAGVRLRFSYAGTHSRLFAN